MRAIIRLLRIKSQPRHVEDSNKQTGIDKRALIVILDELLENINSILDRITVSKLNAYTYTQNQLNLVDVSTDQNYQRTYNGFYRVRLPTAAAYAVYYALIEKSKIKTPLLQEILIELLDATGRVETSFGSKLLATVNPHVAPLDSVVLGHLNLELPTRSGQSNIARIEQCANVHNDLVAQMNSLVDLPQFKILKTNFQNRFPTYNFTDVKILDLLLWQYRP